jgi:hypothetical protein
MKIPLCSYVRKNGDLLFNACRQSYSQNGKIFYLSLFCVNQWEEDKYFVLFRYWFKSKGTLPMSL